MMIATTVIQSDGNYTNEKRTQLLESVIAKLSKRVDLILFPAGFYQANRTANSLYPYAEENIKRRLKAFDQNCIVCLGIDGRNGKDQIGLAINSKGIVALGRKFHPTSKEATTVQTAESELSSEESYLRTFKHKGKIFFLAVCYDGFGITQRKIPNPGVDIVLNMVHGFYPPGEGGSGVGYFARYGFAGSSKQWDCPTFGAAVFFNRSIPNNWPTGVLWNKGNSNTRVWKYKFNPLSPNEIFEVERRSELAKICTYKI